MTIHALNREITIQSRYYRKRKRPLGPRSTPRDTGLTCLDRAVLLGGLLSLALPFAGLL